MIKAEAVLNVKIRFFYDPRYIDAETAATNAFNLGDYSKPEMLSVVDITTIQEMDGGDDNDSNENR